MSDAMRYWIWLKIPLLLLAIGLALTLPVWTAVMQASICGFILGVNFATIMDDRRSRRRLALTPNP